MPYLSSWLKKLFELLAHVVNGKDSVLVSRLFLKIIALIYFAAFFSVAGQITGLLGNDGILPARDYLNQAKEVLGDQAVIQIPTIFWLDSSDFALKMACLGGMAAALLVLINLFARLGLLACYILYLSLVDVGQDFMSFQWDMFLLESGFLALFLPGGSPIVIWLYRFLLFRFMFMGGVVKLASGDPSWSDLSALSYHFETQPLPSPLAWYAHQFPAPFLEFATACVFFIELIVPFFVFLTRPFRLIAAASFLILQGSIILGGNYNFFNILTSALCLFLLQDRDVRLLLGNRLSNRMMERTRPASTMTHINAALMAVFTLSVCGGLLWFTNTHQRPIQPFDGLLQIASNFSLVNGYGPFAVMTTERREIIVEGSRDGQNWSAYEFIYKPGELTKQLTWNIPHQPRLDWQMWFAALGDARSNRWFLKFMEKVREGSRPVLSLLEHNPFPYHPPEYLRASFFRYRFSTTEERASSGRIWQRDFLGYYYPSN